MDNNVLSLLTVTNLIESGAAFAIKHGSGDTCYIPASVTFTSGIKPGDVVEAALVLNPNEMARERTPFMARYVKPKDAPVDALHAVSNDWNKKEPIDLMKCALEGGGVWETTTMLAHLKSAHGVQVDADTVLRLFSTLFSGGYCARFTMVRGPNQPPFREWYTAYPDRADVDEFDEVAQ